jgi:hypothetical protein
VLIASLKARVLDSTFFNEKVFRWDMPIMLGSHSMVERVLAPSNVKVLELTTYGLEFCVAGLAAEGQEEKGCA